MRLVETGDRRSCVPRFGSRPGHCQCRQWRGDSRGVSLGGTRLVVVEAERLGDDAYRFRRTKEIAITMARSSGKAFFANFSTYDGPVPAKVRLALANSWRKVRTRSDCCGNHGEPGC